MHRNKAASWGLFVLACVVCAPFRVYGLSDSPRKDWWVTNGAVRAVVSTSSTIYIGGHFTYVGPNTGSFAALNTSSGAPDLSWPQVDGSVFACVPDGTGGWYIGGSFTHVGGYARNRLAHVGADGTVDAAWKPNASNDVYALAVSGSTVYVGGAFGTVGGASRSSIAALDAATGNATAWNPHANNRVRSLVISDSTIYAGGDFTTIGGASRNRIAAINAATGTATAWNPNAGNTVWALALSGSTVYAGGEFGSIGGASRSVIAAIDATTGIATAWNPNGNGPVYTLAVSGTTVYAGGLFMTIGGASRTGIAAINAATGTATAWNPGSGGGVYALAVSGSTVYVGGTFTAIGGATRNRIAAINSTTGAATAWNPNASNRVNALAISGSTICAGGDFSSLGGVTRNNLAALDATTGTATAWNPNASSYVNALAISSSTIYAGGSFMSIGGVARNRIAAIDITTGTATAWNPNANSEVGTLALSGSTIYAGGGFGTIGGAARNRIAALDATTGTATAWNPNANNYIHSLAVSGSTVYAGGAFTTIGGATRYRIAALDATTGGATAWDPNAGSDVRSLAVSGSTVYAGGVFGSIGGATRPYIAALDATTGTATAWDPRANSTVYALAVSGSSVYAGGSFTNIGGAMRYRIAALDVTTGNATSWNPNINNDVWALMISGSTAYAGGNFTMVAGGLQPYFARFDSTPTMPGSPGASNIGADRITWTWLDRSSDETGFKVYDDAGAGPPTTLQATAAADAVSWEHTGLSTNSRYAFQVASTNALGDSSKTDNLSVWTAIEPVADLVLSGAGMDVFTVAASTILSNLTVGMSGLNISNITAGTSSGWQQVNNAWISSGLTPNTPYTFTGTSRNGAGLTTMPATESRHTLAGPPSAGNNVLCNQSAGTWYPAATAFTFTNPAGFGAGTHGGSVYRVSRFSYAWDASATHSFTGSEADWNTGTLAWTPAVSGSYYLHLRSFNGDGIAGGTVDLGPFMADADAPAAAAGSIANVDQSSPATQYNFTVQYTDDTAIQASSLDSADVRITGPNGFDALATLVSVAPGTNARLETAAYRLVPPGGSWDTADDGSYTISLEPNQVSDAAGNDAAGGELGGFLVQIAPTATLACAAPAAVNGPVGITVTLSASSTDFGSGDIQCTNAAVAGFAGSGTSYSFSLVPGGPGAFACHVPAGNFTNAYGTPNRVSNTIDRTYDNTPPDVAMVSTATPYTKDSPIPVTVTFTKDVTGFDLGDVATANATKGNFQTVDAAHYSFDLTPLTENPVTADIAAGAAQDGLGNTSNAAAQFTRIYDITPPTAVITRVTPAITSADTAVFRVTFDDVVAPTFTSDDLSPTGSLWGAVDITGGPTYTVSITPAPDADGTVSFTVGTDVTDRATNPYAGGTSPACMVFNWHGILTQPTPVRQYRGGTKVLSVVPDCAAGTEIAYLWKWNDGAKTLHLGPAASTWTIPLEVAANGEYWCEMTYDGEMHESDHVIIDVAEPLAAAVDGPATARVYIAGNRTLTGTVTGGFEPVAVQWLKGGGTLPGETATSHAITAAASGDAGAYALRATDDLGTSHTSPPVQILVAAHLVITEHPADAVVPRGDAHTFTVATGDGFAPIRFQWKKDGAHIPGATEASYRVTDADVADAGEYAVDVADAGTDFRTSDSAMLTVTGGGLPAAGVVSLGILGATMLIGAVRVRRKP